MTARLALLVLLAAVPARAGLPVDFEQRLGQRLPLEERFVDADGRAGTLGSFLAGKPAVLSFNYLSCPQLCAVAAGGTLDVLRQLQASVGRDFTVITVSIDPGDTVALAKPLHDRDVSRYGRHGAAAGWHTLVGSPEAVRAVTAAAGFHYTYDSGTRLYAHPTGILVVTPAGVASRYFLGVDYPAGEVAAALTRASAGGVGEPVYDLVLDCLQGGDPAGRYGRLIRVVLDAAVCATLLGLFGGIGWMLRQEFRGRRHA